MNPPGAARDDQALAGVPHGGAEHDRTFGHLVQGPGRGIGVQVQVAAAAAVGGALYPQDASPSGGSSVANSPAVPRNRDRPLLVTSRQNATPVSNE